MFNGPVNTIAVMSRWSVYLTTLCLGRLSPPSSQPILEHILHQKLTTAFLDQRKGENDPTKYFKINLRIRMLLYLVVMYIGVQTMDDVVTYKCAIDTFNLRLFLYVHAAKENTENS